MRQRAIQYGLKLNEYGLFDAKDKSVAGVTEEEIFEKLGLPYVPPVLREDLGEMEAAASGKLPQLVEQRDIQGDLHMHTTWSDGKYSVEGNVIALERTGGGSLVAEVTGNDGMRFNFKMVGAPKEDPGLDFSR